MKLYKNPDNSWTLGTLLSVPSGTCFIEEISADVYAIRFINAPSNIFIGAIKDLERSDDSPYEDIATFLLECGDFFVNPLNPLKEDVEGLQEDVEQLQEDVSAIQGGYLGTLLHTDAAPEPGVSGIYKFISAGVVSWLSGTPTVAVGDEVSVVFTDPTYTYTYIQNPYELLANKQNSLAADGTGTKYPTVDAVNAMIVGELGDSETQVMSQKAVTDELVAKANLNNINIYNVTFNHPLSTGYYDAYTARVTVPNNLRKPGMVITYQVCENIWVTEKYIHKIYAVGYWDNGHYWTLTGENFNDKFSIHGYRIKPSNGDLEKYAYYSVTPFIELGNPPIIVRSLNTFYGAAISFYNKDKIFISSVVTENTNIIGLHVIDEFPDGAVYFRATAENTVSGGPVLGYDGNKEFETIKNSVYNLKLGDNPANVYADNVLTNPNFADLSGWVGNRGNISVSNNELIYSVVENYEFAGITNSQLLEKEHIYYFAFEILPVYANNTYIWFTWNGRKSKITTPIPNEWNRISGLIVPSGTTEKLRIIHDTTNGYGINDEIKFRRVMCIDLTEIYGAGNEPSFKDLETLISRLENSFILDRDVIDCNQPRFELLKSNPEVRRSELDVERSIIDLNSEKAQLIDSYSETLQSLLTLEGANGGEQVITIEGNGQSDEQNKVIRFGLHYGSQKGVNLWNEIFFNSLSKKDFSDIRFEDESGNLLDFKIHHVSNFDFIQDNTIPQWILHDSAGRLIGRTLSSEGLYHGLSVSTDNGQTWNGIFPALNRLEFITSSDELFHYDPTTYKLYKATSADVYATSTEVWDMSGFADKGERLYIDEDSNGNLFCGLYGDTTPQVYKSVDGGLNWSLVYSEPAGTGGHHVHAININPYTDDIYVAIDGVYKDSVNFPRTVKSTDGGATWSILPIPIEFSADGGVLYFGNGYRLFSGENNVLGGASIFKTVDDVNFYPVLKKDQRVYQKGCIEFGNKLLATGLPSYEDKIGQIYLSEDEGETWVTAFAENYFDSNSVGPGYRYIDTPFIPMGEAEMQAIWGYSEGDATKHPLRIFEGGDNYFGLCYVKLGGLPKDGRTIKVKWGYPIKFPKRNPFYDFNDGLVFHAPMKEGRGNVTKELVSGNLIKLPNGTKWGDSGVRYNSIYPLQLTGSKSIQVPESAIIKVSEYNLLPNKNFTLTFWYNGYLYSPTSLAEGNFGFLFGNPNSVHVGVYENNRISLRDGSGNNKFIFMNNEIILTTDYWKYIVITVSNDLLPVIKGYSNGELMNQLELSAWLPQEATPATYFLASPNGRFTAPISDFRCYNGVLSEDQILESYLGFKK